MRTQADFAVFALNGCLIGGSNVQLSKFYPPTSTTNPQYLRLGQYIGQDHHFMDGNTFVPWPSIPLRSGPANTFMSWFPGPGSNTSNNAHINAGSSGLHSNPPSNVDLISANTVPWDGSASECAICLCEQDNTSLSLAQCG